ALDRLDFLGGRRQRLFLLAHADGAPATVACALVRAPGGVEPISCAICFSTPSTCLASRNLTSSTRILLSSALNVAPPSTHILYSSGNSCAPICRPCTAIAISCCSAARCVGLYGISAMALPSEVIGAITPARSSRYLNRRKIFAGPSRQNGRP